ncbi:cell division protein FtsX [Deinococcus lacus]|uniref:Cell division protein FtsX n=1 Tax=Deinococcus lacus TaxID=392561 RepID=A0ABW1YB21_9DEIO
MNYHFRQALLAMRGNLTATLATLTTMTITLLMLGSVVLMALNVGRTLTQLESQVEVAAFLADGADGPALLGQVQRFTEVKSAELVTKEQVLGEMTAAYPYTAQAAELAGNPFPATLRMRVGRVEDTRRVAAAAEKLPGVEGTEFGARYVDQASRTLQTLRVAGWALVGLLLLGTLFSILNAVQVAMYARRNEINVMRLLGARRSFIQMPHILEGLLLGLTASLLASVLLAPTYLELTRRVQELVPVLPVASDPRTLWSVLGGLLGLGLILGLAGSWLASRRYLQELE